MDESGLTAVHKPGRIVAKKGQKQVGKVTSGEKGKTITIVCAVNAAGRFIPPFMIFRRKNMSQLLLKDGPLGTDGAASPSGWTDSDIFIKWLQHFITYAKPTPERPVILLLDGHNKTLAAIDFCRSHNVTLISFPPHTTHRLQPLDLCFFGPLKSFYNVACDNWMTMRPGQRIGFYDIAGLFKTAYLKAATMDKGINGFEVSGIYPLNPNKLTDADFAPSLLTEEDPGADSSASRSVSQHHGEDGATTSSVPVAVNESSTTQQDLEDHHQSGASTSTSATTSRSHPEVHGSVSASVSQHHGEDGATTSSVPLPLSGSSVAQQEPLDGVQSGASGSTTTTPCVDPDAVGFSSDSTVPAGGRTGSTALATSKFYHSASGNHGHSPISEVIQQLYPIPKAPPRQRKRKAEAAEILTSSPYKNAQIVKQNTERPRVRRSQSSKVKDRRKKTPVKGSKE